MLPFKAVTCSKRVRRVLKKVHLTLKFRGKYFISIMLISSTSNFVTKLVIFSYSIKGVLTRSEFLIIQIEYTRNIVRIFINNSIITIPVSIIIAMLNGSP